MTKWGSQKMAMVVPVLRECMPGLSRVCDILRDHLFLPIRKGGQISIMPMKTGTGAGTLLFRVQEAVEKGRLPIRGAGAVEAEAEDVEMVG